MALDNAQFISELSITDPPGSDPLSQGDDQIRTSKRTQFQTFPFMDKQVNLTADQLNLAAIKNEANVFTANQQLTDSDLLFNSDARHGVIWQSSVAVKAWELLADSSEMVVNRYAAGLFVDQPWTINASTGIVNFAQVPTVSGAPLWIAGEIRQFVSSVTPGTNWFLADGTNGTVNLADRWLVGAGAFAGAPGSNLNANLDATAQAGTTGGTALSEAQMPVHTHTVYRTNNPAGGITDAPLNTTDNVVGGRRNDSSKVYSLTNGTRNILGNAGSGSSHNHSSPAQTVVANNPTFTSSVQPVSVAVQTWQYVP